MSQKSSVPQAVSFVSQVLKRDIKINYHTDCRDPSHIQATAERSTYVLK